ncbi:hypothetical protein [Bacillus sp. AFS040349]|uniref:hypothetical protein n=1 Tax=Bacillus sp. AFS040349 TaxID=2033502 RepID=UPI000BFDFA74|nr:hypothetical protein [Bacillus sp. AFS040349]PGT79571.1 hypothetical protein COD11_22295 [Bacillus sp. AFS040349]
MSKLQNSNIDTGDDTGASSVEGRPPRTPRWVKLSGIIVIVLILLVVIMKFIGGGNHGPGRHIPLGDAAGQISPIEQGKQQV